MEVFAASPAALFCDADDLPGGGLVEMQLVTAALGATATTDVQTCMFSYIYIFNAVISFETL